MSDDAMWDEPTTRAESGVLVRYRLLGALAKAPERAYEHDACWDAFASEPVHIAPVATKRVPLGIAVELPPGYELQVRPRSSQSASGLILPLGTVDAGYRDQIYAVIYNSSSYARVISVGDKVCQLAVRPVPVVRWEQVEALSESERGRRGWGSSGTR